MADQTAGEPDERATLAPSPPSRTTSPRTGCSPLRGLPQAGGGRRPGHLRAGRRRLDRVLGRAGRLPRLVPAWDTVLEWDLPFARWFDGGTLNVSYNCLDRHVAAGRGDKVAFHWEGEPGDTRTITYGQLLADVSPVRQRAARPRGGTGRPGGRLHADDPRAGGGHAGLHPHRGGPLGGVRRASRPTPSGTGSSTPRPGWW